MSEFGTMTYVHYQLHFSVNTTGIIATFEERFVVFLFFVSILAVCASTSRYLQCVEGGHYPVEVEVEDRKKYLFRKTIKSIQLKRFC